MTEVRAFTQSDFEAVMHIYREGIETGVATFETSDKSWQDWDQSMLEVCRLVATEDHAVIGWAALMPVSSREVYRGVAEETLYVASSHRGQGVGQALMEALIKASEAAGFWTLQGVILPPNTASIKLHEQFGFRCVGRREKIGQLNGEWSDTLLFERRSTCVGA